MSFRLPLIVVAGALFLFGAAYLGAATYTPAAHAEESDSAVAARRAQLQAELDNLEKQIAANQAQVDKLSAQGQSLSRDVALLNAQIKKAQQEVQATQIAIKQIDTNISKHKSIIKTLSDKLSKEHASLAQILRNTAQIDEYSLVEVALSSEDISTFFGDVDAYNTVKQSLSESFTKIVDTRSKTEVEKERLENQRIEQDKLQQLQLLAKQQVVTQQTQKQQLLTVTKGQQSAYQEIIKTQQKTAGQIRAELFALAGGSGQISLPVAIALAKQAGAATGVRPAFILGVLKQETNLGKNVGQCLLTNSPAKGDGKGKNTGTPFAGVMKPTRDVDPFMAITSALGIDPYAQPVSCPPTYGYGGAMGPGQFIPSTWIRYQDRVASMAGHPNTPANPWNNLDAFTATAIYMSDLGAGAKTPAAERTAALKYFAGGNYSNPAYAFYGDGVMGFAAQFQSDIDTLGGL